MNAYIVDDLQVSRETLKSLLHNYFPEIKIVGESGEYLESVFEIQKNTVDILFLDINLGGSGNGFSILDNMRNFNGSVVLITAYEQYAVKAFKYGVSNYLLKPIDPIELKAAIDRIKENQLKSEKAPQTIDNLNLLDKVALPNKKSLEMVPVDMIVYLEASGSYTNVFLNNDRIIKIAKNLKFVFSLLCDYEQFMRVQKSFVVNKKYISSYLKIDGGQLLLDNKYKIPVSITYREEVLKLFC